MSCNSYKGFNKGINAKENKQSKNWEKLSKFYGNQKILKNQICKNCCEENRNKRFKDYLKINSKRFYSNLN